MKKTGKILLKHLLLACKLGILSLVVSVILSIPTMTIKVHAFGHNNYYGMAYLAEQEARAKETGLQRENKIMTADVSVDAKDKQECASDKEQPSALQKQKK